MVLDKMHIVLKSGQNNLRYDTEKGKLQLDNFFNASAEWKIYSVNSCRNSDFDTAEIAWYHTLGGLW